MIGEPNEMKCSVDLDVEIQLFLVTMNTKFGN